MSEQIIIPGPGGKDEASFRQVGTSPFEAWYLAGFIGAPAVGSTKTLTINTFYAYPFLTGGRGGTIDQIAAELTTFAGTSKFRMGIYKSASDSNLYPGSLLVDGGEVVGGSTGIKASTINQVMPANKLCWLVFLPGVTNPAVRAVGVGSIALPVLGHPAGASAAGRQELTVAQAYGALPGTFPAGGALTAAGGTVAAFFFRYSA